jgi:lysophospholipase L1-like esterase
MGDSLTAGEVTAPIGSGGIITFGGGAITRQILVPAAAYPTVLQSQLANFYPLQAAELSVVNAGVPAENVLDGLARFDSVLTAHQPQAVILMHGVNGIDLIGPDISTEAIRSMVLKARASGARSLVGSMLPTIAGRQRSQNPANLVAYNSKLQQMAAQEGLPFVDLYNVLLPDVQNVIGIDGLHPTEAGYRRIAELYFNSVRANFEATSR